MTGMKSIKSNSKALLLMICMIVLAAWLTACGRTTDEQIENAAADGTPTDTPIPADVQPESDEGAQAPSFPVQFEDPAFERATRKVIGKPEGEILSTDLSGITEIVIWGEEVILDPSIIVFCNGDWFTVNGQKYTERGQIQTLQDVRLFPNLIKLSVNFQPLSDISGLDGLMNLTELELVADQISDIGALEDLIKLEELSLSNNQISDISALAGLVKLKNLSLESNRVADISPLRGLRSLERLSIGNNQISDVSSLKGLTNLRTLFLHGNPIHRTDIQQLKEALPDAEILFNP